MRMDSLNLAETKLCMTQDKSVHANTCRWLYDPDTVSFIDWLQSPDIKWNRPNWIQSKPRSGKSTLMKFAMGQHKTIELLERDRPGPWTLVGFFFHRRGVTVQKSLQGMASELLHSILRQNQHLVRFAIPRWRQLRQSQRNQKPEWDLDSLRSVLKAVLWQDEVFARFCLFLDALDEHGGENIQLVDLVNTVILNSGNFSPKVKVKVCIASRPWPIFKQHFGTCPGLCIHEHTKEDIKTYVNDRLEDASNRDQPLLNAKQLSILTEQLVSKALGVFIWVRLVVDQLVIGVRDGTTFSALMVELEKTPPELEELYRHILRRIDPKYSSETFIMLQIILCSLVPLDLTTFVECVDYVLAWYFPHQRVPNAYSMELLGKDSFASKLLRLASCSGGLLEIVSEVSTTITDTKSQKDRVQFIHQSAKEFIAESRLDLSLRDWNQELNSVAIKTGHEFLLITCGSCDAWVKSIKLDIATYAKLTDEHVRANTNLRADYVNEIDMIFSQRSTRFSTTEGFGFDWWISNQKQEVKELFENVKEYKLERSMTFAVAANLLSYVESGEHLSIYEGEQLMELVVSGPNLVPSGLRPIDRRAMIKAFISRGASLSKIFIPLHPCNIPCISFRSSHSFYVVPSHRWTLLGSLCLQSSTNACDELTRLDLAKYIIELGIDVNQPVHLKFISFNVLFKSDVSQKISPLELSVRYGDASFVRLLLGVGAKRDSSLVEYVMMRGNESILQALKDYGLPFPPNTGIRIPDEYSLHLPALAMGHTLAACSSGIGAKRWPGIIPTIEEEEENE
ncbi:MAG: hypothetical protein LQ342_006329 [Letrouitia transgressa]|nr:MAG: hypothetical protein LQ342_006329 [Letrouitia transgressa]